MIFDATGWDLSKTAATEVAKFHRAKYHVDTSVITPIDTITARVTADVDLMIFIDKVLGEIDRLDAKLGPL